MEKFFLLDITIFLPFEVLYEAGFGEPKSYLSGKLQCVLECKSEAVGMSSGVPLEGHLQPLLFSLSINGSKSVISDSKFFMFADDLKIFRKID